MRATLFCILLLLSSSAPVRAADDSVQTVRDARTVLLEIGKIPEQGIPSSLLHRAHALAVIPHMFKAGFFVGGRYGRGLLLVRQPGGDWSSPVFIELVGGSLGWQIGAQESDLVLVFKTAKSVAGIFAGKVTLGADAGVAAGPVGRRLEGPPICSSRRKSIPTHAVGGCLQASRLRVQRWVSMLKPTKTITSNSASPPT